MLIRHLNYEEIIELREFPPKEWNFNIEKFMQLHWGKSYFYPIVAEIDGKIVGIANAITNNTIGWLGNIIVSDYFRRSGIGKALTTHLINYLKELGCESQVLIATDMGKPLYEKLGFKISTYYVFLKGRKLSSPENQQNIRKLRIEDHNEIYALDKAAMGEQRSSLLSNYLKSGWVYFSKKNQVIEGYFLPDFEHGLVVANNEIAGLSLLQLKHSLYDSSAVLPLANKAGLEFFKDHGFIETKKAPRMYLGKETSWKANMVFSRAAGYSG